MRSESPVLSAGTMTTVGLAGQLLRIAVRSCSTLERGRAQALGSSEGAPHAAANEPQHCRTGGLNPPADQAAAGVLTWARISSYASASLFNAAAFGSSISVRIRVAMR